MPRFLLVASLLFAVPANAQTVAPPSIASLLAGTTGNWTGRLEYRDYQSNRWEGLPMTATIALQGDGATTIRTATFDDGPKTGAVVITTISLVDTSNETESYASFRKGKPLSTGTTILSMPAPPRDATHWTIVAQEHARDGDGLAKLRETTTRDGDTLTVLKEVDPDGDGKDEWLPRNRTILKSAGLKRTG